MLHTREISNISALSVEKQVRDYLQNARACKADDTFCRTIQQCTHTELRDTHTAVSQQDVSI